MAEADYLLRMIQQVGEALARLRATLVGGEVEPGEAEAGLRAAAARAGLDLDLLRAVSPDTLVLLVSPTGQPDTGRTWLTGELFLADASRAEAAGDLEDAADRYRRAGRMYGLLEPGPVGRGLPPVEARLREVAGRLEALAPGAEDA